MRRLFSFSLLLLLVLAACAPGGNAGKCSQGICVKIRSSGPIKKNISIPMTIKVKVDKDMPDLDVSMMIYPGGIIEDATDKSDVTWKENSGITWKKKIEAGKEVAIIQNIRIEEPGDYTVMVMTGPTEVRDLVVLRITEEGGMEYLADTPLPPVTPAPLLTVTPGPSPTFLPTDTLRPSPSPEIVETTPTAEPTEEPSWTPTIPAYP